MPEDYRYDVFISYLHTNPNGREAATYTWVREYVHPELERWLPESVPRGHQARVFLDDINIKIGAEWPLVLQQALQTSRCLLAVLSRQYFSSKWCLAEWNTMLERERLLGLRTPEKPSSLIYPIIFSGEEEDFDETTKTIQQKDLREFAFTYAAFKDSLMYGRFQNAMKEVCQDLSKMIIEAPPWDKSWPVIIPEEEPTRKRVELPKL